MQAFIDFMNEIIQSRSTISNNNTSSDYKLCLQAVELSVGHRWGAAFPIRNCSTAQYAEMIRQLEGMMIMMMMDEGDDG